jgi:hypothetical protein
MTNKPKVEASKLIEPEKPEKSEIDEKKYYNFYFFSITDNIIITYVYILSSIFMNIINRIIFNNYNFKFNFTYMLMQQIFSLIFFVFIGPRFKRFRETLGQTSFNEFFRLKKHIIIFSCLFILNILTSFIGNQKVNTAMFLMLRKFLPAMTFLYDKLVKNKQMPSYISKTVFITVIGTILTGYNDFTSDGFGYLIVFINNLLSVLYAQYSENFSKETGLPVLKLIIYNCYFSIPVISVLIYATGEYTRLENFSGCSFDLAFYIMLGMSFVIILNSSYVLSNSKNSSLFTQLLSNCKVIIKIFEDFFFNYFFIFF